MLEIFSCERERREWKDREEEKGKKKERERKRKERERVSKETLSDEWEWFTFVWISNFFKHTFNLNPSFLSNTFHSPVSLSHSLPLSLLSFTFFCCPRNWNRWHRMSAKDSRILFILSYGNHSPLFWFSFYFFPLLTLSLSLFWFCLSPPLSLSSFSFTMFDRKCQTVSSQFLWPSSHGFTI